LAGESMADASVWADEIRGRRRETSSLHFVNIPLAATQYDSTTQCPGGACIIAAIQSDRRILADSASTDNQRAEALRFLIHFVGDLHQPLHVADHGDRGGNDREVQFFGTPDNLHKVWDGELIERAGLDENSYLERLQHQMNSLPLDSLSGGTVIDWALEGHRIAAAQVYRLPVGGTIGDQYENAELPVVDLAIIKAGVRLARVLNEALAGYTPPARPASLGAGIYSDREAAAHDGEQATVVGAVVTVHHTASGNSYLNFGGDYPHQTFSGFVEHSTDAALRDLDSLAGKRISIRGLITRYNGTPEIRITSRDQITELP
ncbi:MAG: S1/P1 nuclease, partial [Gemmatimonadota bacterium]